jgi:hypothetical protein
VLQEEAQLGTGVSTDGRARSRGRLGKNSTEERLARYTRRQILYCLVGLIRAMREMFLVTGLTAFLLCLFSTGLCQAPPYLYAGAMYCDVCKQPAGTTIYMIEDKVAKTKKQVCYTCAFCRPRCFLCGLPALTNLAGAVQFEDGRTLCVRDAKGAVLNDEEALRIWKDMRQQLEKQFSRFMDPPKRRTSFATIDRLHLENLFKTVGHDYECPNVYGTTTTSTNKGEVEYEVNVLLGLPAGDFRGVCAHEYAHTWLNENLSEARATHLAQPAREGFCELVALLCVDAAQDENAKSNILANAYTRGQIDLFVQAEQTYGLNDVVDWIKYGVDDRLKQDQLLRVRAVEMPKRSAPPGPHPGASVWAPGPVRTYDRLVLKAVFWDARQPTALVNEHTLAPGQEAAFRICGTNLTVQCLEIGKDNVRLRLVTTGEETVLRMRGLE